MANEQGGQVRETDQKDLTTTALTDVHTTPANGSKSVVVTICNRGAATTFSLAVRIGGVAISNGAYHFFGAPLGANQTIKEAILGLNAGDVIGVQAGAANQVSVSVNGIDFK